MFAALKVREAQAKLAALDRVQGLIEFDLDGRILSANGNFLDAVGYTLPEVVGQHHSLFVDPEYRDSADYRAFWERLRGGAFESGQFRRVGRGGRTIWIQASYNPMLDARGRPIDAEPVVSKEIGLNRYERLEGFDDSAARRYRERTEAFWGEVRDAWRDLVATHAQLTLRAAPDVTNFIALSAVSYTGAMRRGEAT